MEDCVAEDVEVTSIVGLVTGVVVAAEKSGVVGLEAADAAEGIVAVENAVGAGVGGA
jgi:hypothetical protein